MGVSFSSAASHRAVKAWGSNGVKFGLGAYFSARPFNFLNIVASGATWGGNPSSGVNAVIARRQGVSFANGALGGNFTDMYALFQFSNVGSPTGFLYGWLELSSFVAPSGTNTTGPRVTVEGWAYDTTGTPIAAGAGNLGGGGNGGPVCGSVGDDHEGGEGDDNGCSVPEPSTAVMFGFAALALGATGLRRWRAARKPAA
jgi:hypothetical protein